jgi:translation initiation factor IF-2
MMFPPNFLHNRLSAHYIEINHIFAIEMMKKYQHARREIIAERETHSDEVKRTLYATNPNYVYEPFGSKDDDRIKRMKDDVREVKEGFECGIKLKNYNDIKESDQLEFFEVKEVARTL